MGYRGGIEKNFRYMGIRLCGEVFSFLGFVLFLGVFVMVSVIGLTFFFLCFLKPRLLRWSVCLLSFDGVWQRVRWFLFF